MTAKIDPEFASLLADAPGDEHEAIVTSREGIDELLDALPDDVEVQFTYRLIRGVALRAKAETLQRLAERPEVQSIEPVRPVQGYS